MQEKVKPLSEAINSVKSGDTVALGGVLNNRLPVALAFELIRKGIKNLDIISLEAPFLFDILIGAGCVHSLDTAFCGFASPGLGFAHMPCFRRAVEGGMIQMKENIGDCLILGFEIGRLGVPFLALNSLSGSDVLKTRPEYFKPIRSPFTGEDMIAIPGYNPDVALIHAKHADRFGNVLIEEAGYGLDEKIAYASDRVIISVEEILPHEALRGKINIPHFLVDAVVKIPWGAYPTANHPFHPADYDHLEAYLKAARSPETFQIYLDKYVMGCKDHHAYVKQAHRTDTPLQGGRDD